MTINEIRWHADLWQSDRLHGEVISFFWGCGMAPAKLVETASASCLETRVTS